MAYVQLTQRQRSGMGWGLGASNFDDLDTSIKMEGGNDGVSSGSESVSSGNESAGAGGAEGTNSAANDAAASAAGGAQSSQPEQIAPVETPPVNDGPPQSGPITDIVLPESLPIIPEVPIAPINVALPDMPPVQGGPVAMPIDIPAISLPASMDTSPTLAPSIVSPVLTYTANPNPGDAGGAYVLAPLPQQPIAVTVPVVSSNPTPAPVLPTSPYASTPYDPMGTNPTTGLVTQSGVPLVYATSGGGSLSPAVETIGPDGSLSEPAVSFGTQASAPAAQAGYGAWGLIALAVLGFSLLK